MVDTTILYGLKKFNSYRNKLNKRTARQTEKPSQENGIVLFFFSKNGSTKLN